MGAMITSREFKSSRLVEGFPSGIHVARVALSEVPPLPPEAEWGQLEHAAGRIAARIALEPLLGERARDAAIVRADDGAPELRSIEDRSGATGPLLSISHGRAAAVAVAAHASALGIDLCDHADAIRVRRVIVRFLAPEEAALAEHGGVSRWIALWALKEAGAKALRRGLLEGGLRATRLASVDPPRFSWPALDAALLYGADDVIAVVSKTD